MEVLPAQAAQALDGRYSYKGAGTEGARESLLKSMEEQCSLQLSSVDKELIIKDREGDALDAVFAALAAASSYARSYSDATQSEEGQIFTLD